MELSILLFYAFIAGLVVTFATGLARRSGRWGGVVAAVPVTPTFAVVLMEQADRGMTLVGGLPSIAATLLVLSLGIRRGARMPIPVALKIVVLVPPIAWALARWAPGIVVIATLLAAAVVAQSRLKPHPRPSIPGGSRSPGARAAIRFLLGALSVLVVGAAVAWVPHLAPLVALFPLVFTAGLAVAEWDGGRGAALRMAAGGVAGSAGVATFAVIVSLLIHLEGVPLLLVLAAGWSAFIATSALWVALTKRSRGTPPIPDRPRRGVPQVPWG